MHQFLHLFTQSINYIYIFSQNIFTQGMPTLSASYLTSDGRFIDCRSTRVLSVCVCVCACSSVRACVSVYSALPLYVCVQYALMSVPRVWVMAVESYGLAILLCWHLLHSSGLSQCRTSHHIEIRALLNLVSNILTCLHACRGLFKQSWEVEEGGGGCSC